MLTRRLVRTVAVVLVLGALLAAIPVVRHAALRTLGALMVTSDPLEPADIGVMTESGEAGELEMIDLYQQRIFSRMMVLMPSPSPVDREFRRRGVRRDHLMLVMLRSLGVPDGDLLTVDAGEGGTSDSTRALASWVRMHPSRVRVIVTPSHTRRYRRTLLRVWPAGVPPPRVSYPRHNLFRVEDWWTSRRTLREGLFELQNLAWDYLRHPW